MVEGLGVAQIGVGDTARVELEVVSVDGDGQGTNFSQDGSDDGFVGGDIGVGGGGGKSEGGVVLARSLDALVGVSSFGFEGGSFEVSESVVHQTTVAALVVLGVAVDELLFGERGQVLAQLDDVLSFDGTSGGESPARAALALVLNGGDGTGGDPVDGGGSLETSSFDGERGLGGLLDGLVVTKVESLEFILREIRELVDGELSEGVVLSEELDSGEVVLEGGEASHLVFVRAVLLAVGELESLEGGHSFGIGNLLDRGDSAHCEQSKDDKFVHRFFFCSSLLFLFNINQLMQNDSLQNHDFMHWVPSLFLSNLPILFEEVAEEKLRERSSQRY